MKLVFFSLKIEFMFILLIHMDVITSTGTTTKTSTSTSTSTGTQTHAKANLGNGVFNSFYLFKKIQKMTNKESNLSKKSIPPLAPLPPMLSDTAKDYMKANDIKNTFEFEFNSDKDSQSTFPPTNVLSSIGSDYNLANNANWNSRATTSSFSNSNNQGVNSMSGSGNSVTNNKSSSTTKITHSNIRNTRLPVIPPPPGDLSDTIKEFDVDYGIKSNTTTAANNATASKSSSSSGDRTTTTDSETNEHESTYKPPIIQIPDTGVTDTAAIEGGGQLWSGWIKYFTFSSMRGATKDSSFKRNNEYLEQIKSNYKEISKNPKALDKDGHYRYIQTYASFYATLFNHSLVISSDKIHKFSKIQDVMNMQFVNPILEIGDYGGGIQDIGKFSEGYCFKIFTTAASEKTTWVFCLDDQVQKNTLMQKIKMLRIHQQRQNGHILDEHIVRKESIAEKIMNGHQDNYGKEQVTVLGLNFNKRRVSNDGYWVIIQDWTECNLKCGGGNSTLQRLCVPPIQGGNPCEGTSVIVRRCNMQPCEGVISRNEIVNKTNEITKRTVVKVLPIYNKPQQYDVSEFKINFRNAT